MRVRRLDTEDAGHVAVHQGIAEVLVLDVDDGGHRVDHLLQHSPAFGDGILGALLIGDIAHRAFIADHLTGLIAHRRGAVGEPESGTAALTHLIFELADHAVALHQRLVFGACRRMDVDLVGDVVDAADQRFRRLVSHHPRQRRIGIEKRASRGRHVNSVDGTFEQLAVAFFGQPLLGQRVNRRFARGIGVDQRPAKHFGGARDVADLVIDIGIRDRGALLARGQRADRVGDRRQRTHGPAHHKQRRDKSDQYSRYAEDNALPLVVGERPGKIVGQHPALPRADFAQQFGHPSDQSAFGPEHVLVELGDLAVGARDRDDRVGIGVDRRAKRRDRRSIASACAARPARQPPDRARATPGRSGSARGKDFRRWRGRVLR